MIITVPLKIAGAQHHLHLWHAGEASQLEQVGLRFQNFCEHFFTTLTLYTTLTTSKTDSFFPQKINTKSLTPILVKLLFGKIR